MSTAFCTNLRAAILSGSRVHQVVSADEQEALVLAQELAQSLQWPLHTWSCAQGIDQLGDGRDFATLLQRLLNSDRDEIWLGLDTVDHWRGPRERRLLRELAQRRRAPALLLIDPQAHPTLAIPELEVHHLPAPSIDDLAQEVVALAQSLSDHPASYRQALVDDARPLARLGLGLERRAFRTLLHRACLQHQASDVAGYLAREKRAAIDVLDYFESAPPAALEQVGGLDELKRWLKRRALALDPRAREHGISPPRGILLVGVQGCGKSLAARACASALNLPLLRLDPGRIFAGTVGASEANVRAVLAQVERLAPAVLWLDEIDKSLAGSDGASSDAGTSARVLATLLTWLAERQATIFVAATANRIDALPPELLRRGRLDEIFFVDLPNADAREAIVEVHLRQIPLRELGYVPPLADPWQRFAAVAREADGYSGAELEAAITEARLTAFARQEPIAARDLAAALVAMIPLQTSHADAVSTLRAWAKASARLA